MTQTLVPYLNVEPREFVRISDIDLGWLENDPLPHETIAIKVPISRLDAALLELLKQHNKLSGKEISLEVYGDLERHITVPDQELVCAVQEFDAEEHGLRNIPGLWKDFKAGAPGAILTTVLAILHKSGNLIDIRMSKCCLHELPIFAALFNEPKISPLDGRLTWSRPAQWNNGYAEAIFNGIAPTLETLELPTTWSIGHNVSSPPYRIMVPIASLRSFSSLRHLTLPYQAIIPRPKTAVSTLPISSLPDTLESLLVIDACPSTYFLRWLRDVRYEAGRLYSLGEIEIRFQNSVARRYYDEFMVEAQDADGVHFQYDPPVMIMHP